jgi:hypothetical protein
MLHCSFGADNFSLTDATIFREGGSLEDAHDQLRNLAVGDTPLLDSGTRERRRIIYTKKDQAFLV